MKSLGTEKLHLATVFTSGRRGEKEIASCYLHVFCKLKALFAFRFSCCTFLSPQCYFRSVFPPQSSYLFDLSLYVSLLMSAMYQCT